jgi:MarR family transcriptional regulator, organic hydroperoxide resistance regulator
MSSNSGKQSLIDRLMFLGQMGSTETALFHQKAADSYGMGITDTKAVSALMQEGPMTAGEIAQRLHVTSGAATNLIDRLESKGVVKRMPDAKDRRKVIVQVNKKAIHDGKHVYESMGKAYSKLLAVYSIKELEMLISYHEKQIAMTKQEIARLANGSNKS